MDFGCGGGIDVILAAHKAGPKGRVIGIDFADQMIVRAKQAVAAADLQEQDIELRMVDLASTQLPDGCGDVVISNCVINLIPDKDAVYREACRILKPGGRIAISDIVLTQNIDPELRERFISTWAGCLGGAIAEEDYMQKVRNAGFTEIQVVAHHLLTPVELAAMALCPGEEFTPALPKEDIAAVEGKVSSIKFKAIKLLH